MEKQERAATVRMQERADYLPPAVDTLDVTVERGFEGSIERVPDTPWE